MKVVIELSPRALKFLQTKAKRLKRSRKNYMELVLTIHSAQKDESIPTSGELSELSKLSPFQTNNTKTK